jgi:sugar O-acyltransferase (sialic acid O-acetyltransferase NeuD family)
MKIRAIYGASGCGKGVMPLLRAEFAVDKDLDLVFVDDDFDGQWLNGHRVFGFDEFVNLSAVEKSITIAIADSQIRSMLAQKCELYNLTFRTVTARQHVCMDGVEIGEGAIFSPFTTLTSNIEIGRHFHCNIGSYVEHDCVIGDFVTFAPGVKCNGNVHIGDHAYIGSGAIIKQGNPDRPIRIGKGAIIGMGAVVTKDIEAGETVVGNPAHPFGH